MAKSVSSTKSRDHSTPALGRRAVLAGMALATAAPALTANAADTDPILEQWRIWHRAYTEEMALEAQSKELYAAIPERLQNPTVCMKWQGSDGPGQVCRFDWEIDSHAETRLLTPSGSVGYERTPDEYKAELATLRDELAAARDRLGLDELGERVMAIGEIRFAAEDAIDKTGGASPVAIAARLCVDLMYAASEGEQFRAKRAAAIAQDLLPLLPEDMAEAIGPLAASVLATAEA